VQVLTACADSFAHGGNDVANSIGSLAAIWEIYRHQKQVKEAETPAWVLFIGAFGIVVGLATYGYNIIRAIGVKMCKITPTRGYCIELGSAIVVVTGSYLGLPLSTTHCQVGGTVAVGLLEGSKGMSHTASLLDFVVITQCILLFRSVHRRPSVSWWLVAHW
jgi:sodium-dependent phosphate transporter